jgi:hypothetical protein
MEVAETAEVKSLAAGQFLTAPGVSVLAKVPRKTADRVSTAIITSLEPIATIVKTLTYDNGKEFAEHSATDKALGSVAYFADPYSSWQRGSNENLNGLVRLYCGPVLRQPVALIQAAKGSSAMFALATESCSALT